MKSGIDGEDLSVGPNGRILLWLIGVVVLLMLFWASVAQLDELVRAEGKVIPSKQVQVIQNLEGGIVKEILVSEGDLVEEGQILLKLDDTRFSAELQDNREQLVKLDIREQRIRAEISLAEQFSVSADLSSLLPDMAVQEESLFVSRLAKLASEKATLDQRIQQAEREYSRVQSQLSQAQKELRLAQEELAIVNPLRSEGVISEIELLKVKKEVVRLEGKVDVKVNELPKVSAKISEYQKQMNELEANTAAQLQEDLSDVLSQQARLSQAQAALKDRFSRTTVRSPVRGTIKQLLVNTIGGVARPGMDLVNIVPIEDALLVEARIRPADIARIFPGQRASIKFTAYDYSIYGGLEGSVSHISADSIASESGESYYLARIQTVKSYMGSVDRPMPIIPGMVVSVDIMSGKRTVIEYLLKPIFKASQVALTEQ